MNQYFFWILIPLVVCLIAIYLAGRCYADRQMNPYEFKCQKKREAFERWHDHQIEQLGTASNTLFALGSVAFGYSLTLLNDSNQSLVQNHSTSFLFFTSAFAVSFIFGLISIANRLEDFRRTKRRHKLRDMRDAEGDIKIKDGYAKEVKALYKTTHRIGAWTWCLLYSQVFFFLLGGGAIICFWIANYTDRF
jgi:uncharacterized membrane protein YbhN (UPF0104 family)